MNLIDENGKHKFGTCYQCGSPIAIPSIEIYKCPLCDWVETEEFKKYKIRREKEDELNRRQQRGEKRNARKAAAFGGLRSTSEENSESSLFPEAAD